MEMGMIRNCNETPFGNGAIGCRGSSTNANCRRRRRRREEGPPACPLVCSVPSQQRLSDPLSLCLPKWAPARHWRRGESPSALRVRVGAGSERRRETETANEVKQKIHSHS